MKISTGAKVALLIVGQICVTVANADAMSQPEQYTNEVSASKAIYLSMDNYYDLIRTKILAEEAPSAIKLEQANGINEALRIKVDALEKENAMLREKIKASERFGRRIGIDTSVGYSDGLEAQFGASLKFNGSMGARASASYNLDHGAGCLLGITFTL